MSPDYDASLVFLRYLYPAGPWVLTAIEIERKGISTRTFRPGDEDQLRKWLDEKGQDHNIYYSVNRPRKDLNKKAERADIEDMCYLQVDIDPRAGEDIDAERARAQKLLKDPPAGIPKPTAIVFSGGGYNALWKLKEPVKIGGDEPAYEDAKRYNLQIEVQFGADSCHNVDRILRLPGTINRPDEKKRKKGRVENLAVLEGWYDDRLYNISEFTQAPLVQSSNSGFGGGTVQVSGNVKRLTGTGDLDQWNVPDRIKALIVQGDDPFDPTKYPSRSEAVFAVCCELVRCDVDDDTIYSVLTDPDFKISESILDKGSRAEGYAIRQIERAREDAIDPWLRELNERHAVIGSLGGKCRVIEEVYDQDLDRRIIVAQTFDDFRNRYGHLDVDLGTNAKGEPVSAPLGNWWLRHSKHRHFNRLLFSPGRHVPDCYNLWQGFSCDAIAGDHHESFLHHVLETICSGDESIYEYVVGWMARAVQLPSKPAYTAIVLRGEKGVGKSFFATQFGSLFGRHFMPVSNAKHLVGGFNWHMMDCVVLFGDEAFYAGDKQHESVLKTLITEDLRTSEAKGRDVEIMRNYIHLIMASNSDWIVPAGGNERRFLVLDVDPRYLQDTAHFGGIRQDLDDGGREALLHFLLTYDLGDYDVRSVPKTKALAEQKALSFSSEEEWWYQKLRDGAVLEGDPSWTGQVVTQDLLYDISTFVRATNARLRISGTRLGLFLSKVLPEGYPKTPQRRQPVEVTLLNGDRKTIIRPRWYVFPDLKACRAEWDRRHGSQTEWPQEIDSEDGHTQDDIPF